MKKKITSLILAAVMVLMSLAGCQKAMDAQTLVQKMDEAMKAQPAMAGKLGMELDMSMGVSGITMDMGVDAEMDMKTMMDSSAAYMDTTMSMELLGQSESFDMEMYMAVEEGKMVSYTYNGMDDSWIKQEIEMPQELETVTMELSGISNENLTLAKEKEQVGEKECYVLTVNMTGEYLQQYMGTAMGTVTAKLDEETKSLVEGMDLSAMSAVAVYHVDPETFLPVQMSCDIQGMGEAMSSMLSGVLAEMLMDLGGEEIEITIDIPTCKVTMTELSYGEMEIPAVPQEGIDAAALNPLQSDGSYVLRLNEEAVRIVLPEGYSTYYAETETLGLLTEDNMTTVDYTLAADVTGDDMKAYMESEAAYAQEEDNYDSHGAGETVNGFETMYLAYSDGTAMYAAWKEMDTAVLVVTVNAGTAVSDLNPLLTAVEEFAG